MKVFHAVLALVGVTAQSGLGVSAQDGPKGPPKYYPKPQAIGVETGEDCEIFHTANNVELYNWPPYGRDGNPEICISFPGVGWFLHKGTNVDCANNCCRWLPPAANDGTQPKPLRANTESWYEINASAACGRTLDDLSATKEVLLPKLMNGENGDETFVCVNTEDNPNSFTKTKVTLLSCSGGCCAFFTDVELANLKAAAESARNPKQN